MKVFVDSWYMMIRHLRFIIRTPFVLSINLIQPLLYLLLFSALFTNIVNIPNFTTDAYIDYLSPGIVIMTTFTAGTFAGMSMIVQANQGMLNRFLVSPIKRSALIFGPLMQNAVTMILQALIMYFLALALGANFSGGISGVLFLILSAVLLGLSFGALSMAFGLLIRQEEGLISIASFITMPFLFISGLFMPLELVPNWMQIVALFNPVSWAVEVGREALGINTDWEFIWLHIGFLTIFFIISSLLAIQSFRKYQQSV